MAKIDIYTSDLSGRDIDRNNGAQITIVYDNKKRKPVTLHVHVDEANMLTDRADALRLQQIREIQKRKERHSEIANLLSTVAASVESRTG